MYIVCKCGKQLTKNLFLSPKPKMETEIWEMANSDDESYRKRIFIIPKGAYVPENHRPWLHTSYVRRFSKVLCVNKDDVLIPLPEYREGLGCCDLWMHPVRCECGQKVAIANLDCHVSLKSIQFYETRVQRVYNKRDGIHS